MYKKENHSLAKINKGLEQMISQWLNFHQEIDSRLITLRIDRIETTKDLSQARVHIYHSDQPADLAKKLNGKSHPLHQYIFKNLKIRRVPKIKFGASTGFSTEQQLTRILDEIDSQPA